jgi:hypothetical protein
MSEEGNGGCAQCPVNRPGLIITSKMAVNFVVDMSRFGTSEDAQETPGRRAGGLKRIVCTDRSIKCMAEMKEPRGGAALARYPRLWNKIFLDRVLI